MHDKTGLLLARRLLKSMVGDSINSFIIWREREKSGKLRICSATYISWQRLISFRGVEKL
jgi:hypothetical protein